MTERPYQDHTPRELDNEKRLVEQSIRHWKKKQREIVRLMGGEEVLAYGHEDYENYGREISYRYAELAAIGREVVLRREMRRKARLAAEENNKLNRDASGSPINIAGNGRESPADDALAAWARKVGWSSTPTGHVTRMDIEWSVGERDYLGIYYPTNNKLVVWMRVTQGTPGARIIKGKSYLRADTKNQIKQAQEAERRIQQS